MISFAAVLACFARVFTTVFFFSRQASVIYAGYGRVFYCICNASALKNCHSSFMLDYDFDCRCLMVLFTDQYLTESLSKPTWKHFIWQKMKWKDGYGSIRWFLTDFLVSSFKGAINETEWILELIPLSQWYGLPPVVGILIPKALVIWASPATLTLTLTQIAKVIWEGDTHITRVLGMGMLKTRGYPYHCNTPLQKL